MDLKTKDGNFSLDHWAARAILASRGRNTPMGALLLAILGATKGRPSFGTSAIIFNGNLIATYIDRDAVVHPSQVVCSVDDFKKFLSDLAVKCDMTDAECNELFDVARRYIQVDTSHGGTDLLGKFEALKGQLQ